MEDLYKELGLTPKASHDEIRHAFRVLARRYHPDVNPGSNTADKFKRISAAYEILGNSKKRRRYDQDLATRAVNNSKQNKAAKSGYRAYRAAADETVKRSDNKESDKKAHSQREQTKPRHEHRGAIAEGFKPDVAIDQLNLGLGRLLKKVRPDARHLLAKPSSLLRSLAKRVFRGSNSQSSLSSISVVEVSISVFETLKGVKKIIELADHGKTRKISVEIPSGVRTGSVIRLKAKGDLREELVIIVRINPHPFLSMGNHGLIIEVPITVAEAVCGAVISVPSPDGTTTIKIQPGTQSGDQIRITKRGVIERDGSRGDLFCKLLIKVPESTQAIGLNELALEFSKYYSESPRKALKLDIFSK